MTLDDFRYPIGPFDGAGPFTLDSRRAAIEQIVHLPSQVRDAVRGLSDAQLDTPYRPEGWTVRQVVHHLADSHMNGFIRVRLALTEDGLVIKPYDENAWAKLSDARLPVEHSLTILDGLHVRWAHVYRSMDDAQYARSFIHPEHGRSMTLEWHVHNYGWHSAHHLAHITRLRARQGW
jgi:hypothetical protein